MHALEAGARDFISKPFELQETLARIHNMLEARLLHVAAKNRINVLEHELGEVTSSNNLLRRQRADTQR